MMCVLRLTTVIWEELDLFTLLKLHQNFGGQTLFFEIEYDPVGSNRIGNRVLGLMFFKSIFHLWAF